MTFPETYATASPLAPLARPLALLRLMCAFPLFPRDSAVTVLAFRRAEFVRCLLFPIVLVGLAIGLQLSLLETSGAFKVQEWTSNMQTLRRHAGLSSVEMTAYQLQVWPNVFAVALYFWIFKRAGKSLSRLAQAFSGAPGAADPGVAGDVR